MEVGTVCVRPVIGSIRRDIRVSSPDTVVEAPRSIDINAELGIIRIRWVRNTEVFSNCGLLVLRLWEIIGKSSRRREILGLAAQVHVHDTFGV